MRGLSAARVRKIRKELHFTREQFARVLWVALKTVDEWESGAQASRRAPAATAAT